MDKIFRPQKTSEGQEEVVRASGQRVSAGHELEPNPKRSREGMATRELEDCIAVI